MMPNLAFVFLTRHSAASFGRTARDIAAVTRPRDEVILCDDGSTDHTVPLLGRWTEMEGWGQGVAVQRIVSGCAMPGDLGIATNVALAAATATRVLVLSEGARLYPEVFNTARDTAEARDLDLMVLPMGHWEPRLACALPPPPPTRQGPLFGQFPALSHLLLRRALLDRPALLRAAEGLRAHGDLGLIWGLCDRAGGVGVHDDTVGLTGGRLFAPQALFDRAVRLLPTLPDDAARQRFAGWIAAVLPACLRGQPPGGDSATLAGLARFGAALGPQAVALGAFARPDAASLAALRGPRPAPAAPAVSRRAMLRVALTGAHKRRIALSYDALTPLLASEVTVTPDIAQADLVLFGHPLDVIDCPPEVQRLMQAARRPLALLSEEPFWDSLFSPDPCADVVTIQPASGAPLRLFQVNHHTSDIFAFDRIPYILLTEHRFVASLAACFRRNAQRSAADWRTAFATRQGYAAYMAERRTEPFHNVTAPEADLIGLCAWRTELALAPHAQPVDRIGSSWEGGQSRFELSDWHLDKLTRLNDRYRFVSAVENTHQPAYVSEKLFDAYACGARPLYHASDHHRVHRLGLPAASWVNLSGLTPDAAAAQIGTAAWDDGFFDAYAAAQVQLAALFSDTASVVAERERLGRAIIAEIRRMVDAGPA